MNPRSRSQYEFVPQAILNRAPDFFGRMGVDFRKDIDDLNEYQVAELALDGEVPFALMRHEGTPFDETEVYLPEAIPLDQVPSIIGRILREFDLSSAAVKWQRQRSDTPF